LKPYGIKPTQIRFKDKDKPERGYYKSAFEDAWKRYLPDRPEISVTSVTEVTPVTKLDTNQRGTMERYFEVYPKTPVTKQGASSSFEDFKNILNG
jgi:hypothetical protein